MATGTAIQIAVSPEAAERIAQLGIGRSCEALIEHAQEAVPDLRTLEVSLEYDPDEPREPTLVLNMYRPHPVADDDAVPRQWRVWMAQTFPAQVCQHFALVSIYE